MSVSTFVSLTTILGLSHEPSLRAKFFRTLHEKMKIIYDWNLGVLWVIDGDDESVESSRSPISGDDFVRLTGIEITNQSDLIIALLRSGIEIEVRNYRMTFKTTSQFQDFMDAVERIAQSKSG